MIKNTTVSLCQCQKIQSFLLSVYLPALHRNMACGFFKRRCWFCMQCYLSFPSVTSSLHCLCVFLNEFMLFKSHLSIYQQAVKHFLTHTHTFLGQADFSIPVDCSTLAILAALECYERHFIDQLHTLQSHSGRGGRWWWGITWLVSG